MDKNNNKTKQTAIIAILSTQRCLLFSVAMAAGTKLFPKQAPLHLRALYLCPEGSGAEYSLSPVLLRLQCELQPCC